MKWQLFNSNVESEYESCYYFEMNGDTDETSYDDNEKSEYSSINEFKKSSHQSKQSIRSNRFRCFTSNKSTSTSTKKIFSSKKRNQFLSIIIESISIDNLLKDLMDIFKVKLNA